MTCNFQIFIFQTHLISLDALHKTIDPSQLTQDLEGTLHYDHATWIELRCVSAASPEYVLFFKNAPCNGPAQALEDFLWQSCDLLDRLDSMRSELSHNDFADDVGGARAAADAHNEAKRRILKVPVENVDNVGQRILQR